MSINWVMLEPFRSPTGTPLSSNTGGPPLNTFVRLPREKLLFSSPPRTTLEITSPNASSTYPGREPISVYCASGVLYLTNQRLVYLPLSPTPKFQSFSAPILNLQDTHVYAPFFGANAWHGLLKCVPGGGINARHGVVDLKMTFKEGGAYDFANAYERVKEQAVRQHELADAIGSVGAGEVSLEPLPVYEARDSTRDAEMSAAGTSEQPPPLIDVSDGTERGGEEQVRDRRGTERSPGLAPPVAPNEPPPAYEA